MYCVENKLLIDRQTNQTFILVIQGGDYDGSDQNWSRVREESGGILVLYFEDIANGLSCCIEFGV